MEVLWAGDPFTVREVMARTEGDPAYTTVMTTLDRLFKKGLLDRRKDGSAFVYSATMSRDEYHQAVAQAAIGELLQRSTAPVLAAFVDAAATIDEDNLRRLEQLIAAHRRNNGHS